MENYKNKTAFITGASGGIGYEFAKLLSKDKYNLILTGRNKEKLNILKSELENSYSPGVTVLAEDLSNPEGLKNICTYIENIKIDVLINNAGFGVYGDFIETDPIKETNMINVNIIALTHLTKIVLKNMIKINSGKILNVASTAAFKPGPLMSVYYATKAYVLSFSESIAAEIRNTGVSITVLCPGPTDTEFFKKVSDTLVKLMKFNKMSSPAEVAACGYKAMNKNKLVAIPGLTNRVYTVIVKFFPRKLFAELMYVLKKRNK